MNEYSRAPSRVGERAARACAVAAWCVTGLGSIETNDRMGKTRSAASKPVLGGWLSFWVTDCARSLISGRMSSDLNDPVAILSDLFRGDPGPILSGAGDAIRAVQSDSLFRLSDEVQTQFRGREAE